MNQLKYKDTKAGKLTAKQLKENESIERSRTDGAGSNNIYVINCSTTSMPTYIMKKKRKKK